MNSNIPRKKFAESSKNPRTGVANVYTDDACPVCAAQLFATMPPWEVKLGEAAVVDTCLTHGKVT